MTKRNLFSELMEGVSEMAAHREGKVTLRSHKVEAIPLPKVTGATIKKVRESLRCSRSVFARALLINERTLEKWEQNRAKPNAQAAALVLLVKRYPDTIERLATLASR